MRTINKNDNPPECLAKQPKNQPWRDFIWTECHAEVSASLEREQQGLCCYCEMKIGERRGFHIEHIAPRGGYQNCTYYYSNLAASCDGGGDNNRHCGHHKKDSYDAQLFLSPHNQAATSLFQYHSSGKIKPKKNLKPQERDKAEYMIAILNLNCPDLEGRRKRQAHNIINILGPNPQPEMIPWAIKEYLAPGENDNLPEFPSLSKGFIPII